MKLLVYELHKLFGRKSVIIGICLIIVANFFLLWVSNLTDYTDSHTAKEFMSDIESFNLKEKQEFVENRYEMILAFQQIDAFLKYGTSGNEGTLLKELLKKYGDLYNTDIKLYTDNFETERNFLSSVRSELETVAEYPHYLDTIQTQASLYQQITIFNKPSSFDQKNILKTADDYSSIQNSNIRIDYYPQIGFVKSVTFEYTDVLLLITMLLFSGTLVYVERDSGMLNYIKTHSKGRGVCAISKCAAISVATLLIVIVLYSENLIFFSYRFGLGSLNRSIQSIPFLMRSTAQITLGQYLLLFTVAKWFSASILGLIILVVTLCCKKFYTCILISFTTYFFQVFIFNTVPLNSKLSFLKYLNISGILHVNTWIGSYYNFNIGGYPVGILPLVLVFSLIFIAVFFSVFVLLFSILYFNPKNKPVIKFRHSAVGHTTIFGEELHKTFVLNGAVVVLLLLLALEIIQGLSLKSMITPEEMYYRHYMLRLSGIYDNESYEFIKSEFASEDFVNLNKAEKDYDAGIITQNEYQRYIYSNYGTFKKHEALSRIISDNILQAISTDTAWIVYETGYEILFDKSNKTDIVDILISSFVLSITLSCSFAQEYQCGAIRIISTTPLGRKNTVINKIKVAIVVCFLVSFITGFRTTIYAIRYYGIPALFAPLKSLHEFASYPIWFSIALAIIARFILRFFSNIFYALIILYLSSTLKQTVSTLFLSSIILCVPPGLVILGFDDFKLFTIYPLYHFPQITYEYNASIVVILLCFIALYGYVLLEKIGAFDKD